MLAQGRAHLAARRAEVRRDRHQRRLDALDRGGVRRLPAALDRAHHLQAHPFELQIEDAPIDIAGSGAPARRSGSSETWAIDTADDPADPGGVSSLSRESATPDVEA